MKLTTNTLSTAILNRLKQLARYRVVLFCLLTALLYGYLIMQLNQAANIQPASDLPVTSTKKSLKIDEDTVRQLEQLQDNSVSVQALFNEARTNPFE